MGYYIPHIFKIVNSILNLRKNNLNLGLVYIVDTKLRIEGTISGVIMTIVLKEKFHSSTFRNKIKNGKLICPICGERVQRISKKNQFINSPAGIYLIFSSSKCKKTFVTLMNKDNSEIHIKNILENNLMIKE